MIRILGYAVLVLVLLTAAAFALAAVLLEPRAIAEPLALRASRAIGEPVRLGTVDLRLFPTPAARVQGVEIGSRAQPLAAMEEIRVTVSLPALLFGQVVLRSLEIDAPRLRLELGPDGRPRLPAGAGAAPAEPAGESEEGAPLIAITALEVRDGELLAGPWKVSELEASGGLGLDGDAHFTIRGEIEGIGSLSELEVELTDLLSDRIGWRAQAELPAADLAGLAQRLELAAPVSGTARVFVRAEQDGAAIERAELVVESSSFAYRDEERAADGALRARAVLGDRWSLDLSELELRQGEQFMKPRGETLTLAGPLGHALSPSALGPLEVQLGPNRIDGQLALADGEPRLHFPDGTLDLAPLAPWFQGEIRPESGQIRLRELSLGPSGPELSGELELLAVALVFPHGTVSVDGGVQLQGPRLMADSLEIATGGSSLSFELVHDLSAGRLQASARPSGVEVEPFVELLSGQRSLAGELFAELSVRGPLDPSAIEGGGSFEIAPGRIYGFSIMRALLGELAALPTAVALLRGKDLSRYEEEEFRRLAGRVRLLRGEALLDELLVEYLHLGVELQGSVALADGALNLRGRAVLSEELDSELSGQRGRSRVIPIEGVRGTVAKPRIVLDQRAVASALATYATGGRLREKLEERVGSEGADLIEGVLDQLLRGTPEP